MPMHPPQTAYGAPCTGKGIETEPNGVELPLERLDEVQNCSLWALRWYY